MNMGGYVYNGRPACLDHLRTTPATGVEVYQTTPATGVEVDQTTPATGVEVDQTTPTPKVEFDQLLSPKDIKDKSKVDGFANFVALLQLLWFVTQMIARWSRGLPPTELEVVTLSFAFLSLAIYACWWRKPAKVDSPHVLKSLRISGSLRVLQESESLEVSHGGTGRWLTHEFDWLVDKVFCVPVISDGRVPMSWAPISAKDSEIAYALASAFALLFGALHFMALNYPVPSRVESQWWLASSIILVVSPAIFLAWFVGKTDGDNTMLARAFHICSLVVIPIYITARLSALVLAFTSLRELPDSAYQTSAWLNAILHI